VCAFRFKLRRRLESLAPDFSTADIPYPRCVNHRGCADQRGPTSGSYLGSRRRVNLDEVSVKGADGCRDRNGSIGGPLARTCDANDTQKDWAGRRHTTVFLLPVGPAELVVRTLTVTGYGVGHWVAALKTRAVRRRRYGRLVRAEGTVIVGCTYVLVRCAFVSTGA
jgi:hypothetical protein